MKGFIIFEDFKKNIICKEILDGDYNCVISDYPNGTFSGIINRVTGATCNKSDTYDFETGALIALMKMCGFDKVKRAVNETFPDVAENSVNEYEEEIKNLKKENEKLQHEYDLCKNSENALKCSVDYLNKTIAKLNIAIYGYKEDLNKFAERCKELEEENEKLKLDCEKLQHGYLDTDMIFCGGRQNGKQYTLLVDLFKKVGQKKVDEAYKEAYNTKLPVYQREFLKEALSIYKPPTKREEMWDSIISSKDKIGVCVNKEDIVTFLKEIETKIPDLRWMTNNLPTETLKNPCFVKDAFEKDKCYFFINSKHKMSYENFLSPNKNYSVIDYLPPMRWDLFKKGRIVVGVRKEQYTEFREKIMQQFGKVNIHNPYYDFKYSFFIYDKHAKFVESIDRSQFRQQKIINNHKVVYWEDVR